MDQQPQTFSLADLNGADIEAIMAGLGELPAKSVRGTMNKIEVQIVEQLRARQIAAASAPTPAASSSDDE